MKQAKTALITGSTSGIGLGIAEHFAKSGFNIIMNGLGNKAEIESATQSLRQHQEHHHKNNTGVDNGVDNGVDTGGVIYHPADMRDKEQIKDMVASADKAFGGTDILVNCAGIQNVQKIEEFSESKWEDIISINLSSCFYTTRYIVPHMKMKRWGRIINIGSVHSLVASPFKSAYVAAKHGLAGFTKATALELGEYGITCNCICPGYVETNLVKKQIPEQMKVHNFSEEEVKQKIFFKNHAVKEFISVEQIASFALYLCGDEARTITGSTLTIDSGWNAQ